MISYNAIRKNKTLLQVLGVISPAEEKELEQKAAAETKEGH